MMDVRHILCLASPTIIGTWARIRCTLRAENENSCIREALARPILSRKAGKTKFQRKSGTSSFAVAVAEKIRTISLELRWGWNRCRALIFLPGYECESIPAVEYWGALRSDCLACEEDCWNEAVDIMAPASYDRGVYIKTAKQDTLERRTFF